MADVELLFRIWKQDGEIVQNARGFKQGAVIAIMNDSVVVLLY